MVSTSILATSFIMSIFAAVFVIGSVVLTLLILIQKGKGGGLSGAFSGGMASNILGSKTGDILTVVTICAASLFVLTALVLDKWWKPSSRGPTSRTAAPITSNDTGRTEQPAPATPAQEQPGQGQTQQ
jgi:preprotein translocase subunit SecG